MVSAAQLEKNKEAFAAAKVQAESQGGQVCGTYGLDGVPRYFVMPKAKSDLEIQDEAFRVRNGRLPSESERTVGRMVEAQRAKAG